MTPICRSETNVNALIENLLNEVEQAESNYKSIAESPNVPQWLGDIMMKERKRTKRVIKRAKSLGYT